MIRQTSLEAYQDICGDGSQDSQLAKVFKCLRDNPGGLNFYDIERITGIQKTSVTARVRKLCQMERVCEVARVTNPVTHKSNILWGVK